MAAVWAMWAMVVVRVRVGVRGVYVVVVCRAPLARDVEVQAQREAHAADGDAPSAQRPLVAEVTAAATTNQRAAQRSTAQYSAAQRSGAEGSAEGRKQRHREERRGGER
jgi:hypothetical protein